MEALMRKVFALVALATGVLAGWPCAASARPAQAASLTVTEIRARAERGSAEAQYALGWMYLSGEGVQQDDVQAVAWYRKAADQGAARAQGNLGWLYATGRGVPRDPAEGYKWVDLAASRASGEDQKKFAEMRDQMAAKMTPAQLAEARKRVRAWAGAFERRQKR
jgi:uncharacterized protein